VSTQTKIPAGEPTIVMTRIYDAPRDLVWQAMTEAKHVRRWWGGPGFSNPVCEMDVRPGGLWNHVMRFPDGQELHLAFVFLEVEKPTRLLWQHTDYGKRKEGLPAVHTTVTLDDFGGKTRWTMVARFLSVEDRDAAVGFGFSRPIEASNDRLVEYLKTM
jgi:uncharacterized protein YndB with AHSA1/START domain